LQTNATPAEVEGVNSGRIIPENASWESPAYAFNRAFVPFFANLMYGGR